MKRILPLVLLLAGLAGIVGLLMSNRRQQQTQLAEARTPLPVTVAVAPVVRQSLPTATEYVGKTEAWREVLLTATTQGIIRQLDVRLNGPVRQGQRVARVDTDLMTIQLTAAEAALAKARTDLSRYETLLGENNATPTETEAARLQVVTAQSQVQTARKQLRDAVVKAPIGGTVTEKLVETGMFVAPGTALLTITDVAAVKVVLNVPEAELSQFTPGRVVPVVFDAYPQKLFRGTVHYIRLKGGETGRFPVEIRVVNRSSTHPLRVGMTGTVRLPTATPLAGLTIPRAALSTQNGPVAVYVLRHNRVTLRPVQTGQTVGTSVLVRRGLQAGEQVVISGTDELRNGQTVTAAVANRL